MGLPRPLQKQFEVIQELPTGKLLECFRVRARSANGQERVLRVLPAKLSQDQDLVDEFHKFFSRFSTIANRSHIPFVYSVAGVPGGTVYVLEECVAGIPFPQFVETKRASESFVKEVIGVLSRVCEALHHAHQKGIFHLCITPEDILVDEATGKVKLVGFGSQIFCKGNHLDSLSVKCKGYVAPEIFKGQQYGPYSDVYSLAAAVNQAVPEIWEHGDLLTKAMAVNEVERYQRVRDFGASLKEIADGQLRGTGGKTIPSKKTKGGLKPVRNVCLVTEPSEATVKIDGNLIGTTTSSGLIVSWKPGMTVLIEKPGYASETLTLTSPPEDDVVRIRLNSVPLRLITNPWGAWVEVSGKRVGTTNRGGLDVPWDQGEIVIEKEGYEREQLAFELAPTESEFVVDLKRTMLPASARPKFLAIAATMLVIVIILLGVIWQTRQESQKQAGISAINAKLHQLEAENQRLKLVVKDQQQLQQEIADLRKMVAQTERDKDALKASYAQNQREIDRLKGIEREKQKLDQEVARLSRIEKEKQEADKEIASLKGVTLQKDREIDNLNRNITQLQQDISRFKGIESQRQQLEAAVTGLRRELQAKAEEIERLRKEIAALRSTPKESAASSQQRQEEEALARIKQLSTEYYDAMISGDKHKRLSLYHFPMSQYFSKSNASRSFVENDMDNYYSKWDRRSGSLQSVSVLSGSPSSGSVMVRLVYDYTFVPKSGSIKRGRSTTDLSWQNFGGTWKIKAAYEQVDRHE